MLTEDLLHTDLGRTIVLSFKTMAGCASSMHTFANLSVWPCLKGYCFLSIMLNAMDNYRPISCLPLMWKVLVSRNSGRSDLHVHGRERELFPDEQKRCKGRQGAQRSATYQQIIVNNFKEDIQISSLLGFTIVKLIEFPFYQWLTLGNIGKTQILQGHVDLVYNG